MGLGSSALTFKGFQVASGLRAKESYNKRAVPTWDQGEGRSSDMLSLGKHRIQKSECHIRKE